MGILDTFVNYLSDSGFGHFHWTNAVMIGVGILFIYLAVKRGFEPLLLVPIGFGILIGNVPYDASKLPLSVYDGPVSQRDLAYYAFDPNQTIVHREGVPATSAAAAMEDATEGTGHERLMRVIHGAERIDFGSPPVRIEEPGEALRRVHEGSAVMVNLHSVLTTRRPAQDASIVAYGQGRHLFVLDTESGRQDRFPEVWSLKKQDPASASVLWWLFAGVGLAGFYPPLIFLGIGALTDFGPMLANPKTLLLGAAAQFGIFASLIFALLLGFSLPEAASIGIIGGADGPTAIFTCAQLAPDLLGAVALAAYSYMAMVPIIQPPIIRLLTTQKERRIRMEQLEPVSQRVKIAFPVICLLLTAFIAPAGLPLLGMLFFGNLLRESMVTERLAKTAQAPFIDIVTILLGVTVGAKTSAPNFLTMQTVYVFILGVLAFGFATAAGVLFGKLMNAVSRSPVNPMIGAAGVSAVPMAARVVSRLGQREDPHNILLMHAMGPNVAGVIGSAVAAGVMLSALGGS